MSSAPHSGKTGLSRLVSAFKNSCNGFVYAWNEPAFRQELAVSALLLPAAFWVGQSWIEVCILIGVIVFVLVTEILNTAVEAVVDRVGPEWHALSKSAKDMGSAAVLMALGLALMTWVWAIYERLST